MRRIRNAAPEALPLVRRPTGGLAVVHRHDLSYSLVLSPSSQSGPSEVNRILARGIAESFGMAAEVGKETTGNRCAFCCECPSRYDMIVDGRKVGGACFRKKQGVILQQGFIALLPGKGSEVSLSSLIGREVAASEVADAMVAGLDKKLRLENMDLSSDERRLAERLSREKYGSREWTERR